MAGDFVCIGLSGPTMGRLSAIKGRVSGGGRGRVILTLCSHQDERNLLDVPVLRHLGKVIVNSTGNKEPDYVLYM